MQRAPAERMSQPVRHLFVVPGSCGPSIITALQRCNEALTRLTFNTAGPPTHLHICTRTHRLVVHVRYRNTVSIAPYRFYIVITYSRHKLFLFSFLRNIFCKEKKNIKQTDKKYFPQCCCLCPWTRQIFSVGKGWRCLTDSSEYYLWNLSNHLDDSLVLASGCRACGSNCVTSPRDLLTYLTNKECCKKHIWHISFTPITATFSRHGSPSFHP